MVDELLKIKVEKLISVLTTNQFGLRPSVIAEMTQIPRGEVSRIFAGLEAQGIVIRKYKNGGILYFLKQ